jgi:hypothetical protein
MAFLCDCTCHSACPVANQSEVTNEQWVRDCTCPGSVALKEILLRIKEENDLHQSQRHEVFRGIDLGHGKSAEQIQREILAAYDAKGYEAPTDFSRISRFVAANTARRGTRTVRVLVEIVGALRAARRWAEKNISQSDSLENRKELGRMRRSAGVLTVLALSTVVGAHFTRGFIRLGCAVLSVLLGIVAAWVGLWVSAISSVTRSPRRGGDPS